MYKKYRKYDLEKMVDERTINAIFDPLVIPAKKKKALILGGHLGDNPLFF